MIRHQLHPVTQIESLYMKFRVDVVDLVSCILIGYSRCICTQNFGSIGPVVAEIQNKVDLTFDLHLHNEDDLISTWFYYVIWLADPTAYAYKISDRLVQWLLRCKTKGMRVWACGRVCT